LTVVPLTDEALTVLTTRGFNHEMMTKAIGKSLADYISENRKNPSYYLIAMGLKFAQQEQTS
jgi:hypothetical protein